MIHKRWIYFILSILCAATGGILFTFEQPVAGTCILLLTGILCISFVTSPNGIEPPAHMTQPVFIVNNPQRIPEVVIHAPNEQNI